MNTKIKVAGLAIAALIAVVTPRAQAADSAIVNLSLTPAATTSLTVNQSNLVLAPANAQQAFNDGYILPSSASAITGSVTSNTETVTLTVTAGSGSLLADDLIINHRDPSEAFQISTKVVAGEPKTLNSALVPGAFAVEIGLDNYRNYTAGTTYTNTLTLAITPN